LTGAKVYLERANERREMVDTMEPLDNNPDESNDVAGHDETRQRAGDFTRAFSKKEEQSAKDDFLGEEDLQPAPGSLTQLLGAKSKQTSPLPRLQTQAAVSNSSETRPADSFTKAFDGVHAFTRNPADLGEFAFPTGPAKVLDSDVGSSESPGSFTRLFGSGEGVLTPSVSDESPNRPINQDRSRDGWPESKPERNYPSTPPGVEPGSFTQAFDSRSAPEPPASKTGRGTFTDEFEASSSWPVSESLPPSRTPPTYTPQSGDTVAGYSIEPALPSPSQRPPKPPDQFDRLIDPLRSESTPLSDGTAPSARSARPPERPLPDLNYGSRRPTSGDGATIVFNSGQPEVEIAASPGKSEYTMVVERSRLRPPLESSSPGASPYGAVGSSGSPSPAQFPQAAPPAPLTWQPAPAPPWQPPQLTPPSMQQASAVAPPASPLRSPTLGDKLVSFLPFILSLTVLNFLGLLAILIIIFATRK
jgi:hypothetical protein